MNVKHLLKENLKIVIDEGRVTIYHKKNENEGIELGQIDDLEFNFVNINDLQMLRRLPMLNLQKKVDDVLEIEKKAAEEHEKRVIEMRANVFRQKLWELTETHDVKGFAMSEQTAEELRMHGSNDDKYKGYNAVVGNMYIKIDNEIPNGYVRAEVEEKK